MEIQVDRRSWRKLIKKLQRKKRRQKAATERKKEYEEQLKDPTYQYNLHQQELLDLVRRDVEKQQHDDDEEAWLRRELISQKEFHVLQKQREAEEAEREVLRLQQKLELERLEIAKQKRKDELEKQQQEAAEKFERMLTETDEYLSNASMATPPSLRQFVDSRPFQQVCAIFDRMNCCKFGLPCIYNHRRPLLSRILFLPNFFSHPLLDQAGHQEYRDAPSELILCESDLQEDYSEFFMDVVPEFQKFGEIKNFRTTCNVLSYLRGHVFVEFFNERSALKAFIHMHGRYYACKRINVEFSNLVTWRKAVCDLKLLQFFKGLRLAHKCPKGYNCSNLHIFKNPQNKYNYPMEPKVAPTASVRKIVPIDQSIRAPLLSWNEICSKNLNVPARNMRWSESPEVQLKLIPTASPIINSSTTTSIKTDSHGNTNNATKKLDMKCSTKDIIRQSIVRRDGTKDKKSPTRQSRPRIVDERYSEKTDHSLNKHTSRSSSQCSHKSSDRNNKKYSEKFDNKEQKSHLHSKQRHRSKAHRSKKEKVRKRSHSSNKQNKDESKPKQHKKSSRSERKHKKHKKHSKASSPKKGINIE